MSLGSQVRKYRQQLGWTLEELEKRSGVARGTISALEKRGSNRSEHTQQLAAAFGLTVEQLVDEETNWLDRGTMKVAEPMATYFVNPNPVPSGYIRLEHLSPEPSMGRGLALTEPVQIVQYLDVLEQWVRQEVGTTNPARIKVLTGNGNSMAPTIKDKDLVFVDVECRSIETAGIYVLDVAGRLILKKAMILANGTLVIRSDNVAEYPDEERYDLRHVGDAITVCGKVLAWWTLGKA